MRKFFSTNRRHTRVKYVTDVTCSSLFLRSWTRQLVALIMTPPPRGGQFQNKKVKALLRFHLDMIPLTSEKHDPRFTSRDWFHQTVEDWRFSLWCVQAIDTQKLFHTRSHQRTVEILWRKLFTAEIVTPACLQGFAFFWRPGFAKWCQQWTASISHLGSSCRALIGRKVLVSQFFFFLSQKRCGPAERVSWPHHLRGEVIIIGLPFCGF